MRYRFAIGFLELNSIAQGYEAADAICKAADITLHMAKPVCPGRFAIMFSGQTSAVKASLEAGTACARDLVVDQFLLSQIHEDVLSALNSATEVEGIEALGIIETSTIASSILAADGAAKAAEVTLIEVRTATGMAGKSYMSCTGSVAAVTAGVEAGIKAVGSSGPVLVSRIIPSVDDKLKSFLL